MPTKQILRAYGIALFVLMFGGATISGAPKDELVRAVASHFRAPDERKSALKLIESLSSGDVLQVAEAIRSAPLWDKLPENGNWEIELAPGRSVSIVYKLPPSYDPAVATPLVICMPSRTDAGHLALIECMHSTDCALVSMSEQIGGAFHIPEPSRRGDFTTVLRNVRQRIHTEPNRTFLSGTNEGGDAAWALALCHPDVFAGVAVHSAYPIVPHPESLLPILHENLRSTAFHTAWRHFTDAETQAGEPSFRESLVRAFNFGFVSYAEGAGLRVDARAIHKWDAGSTSLGFSMPKSFMNRREISDNVSLWFRYPQHGRIAWLRQTKWSGPIWDEEVISVLPAATTDRNEFITDVLKDKLAYLSGRKEGQTIHIETQKCAELELRVPESWDTSKPFTIFINGRKRFDDRFEPSIKTMLECAAEDWDTQNLVVAKKRFLIAERPSRE